jgi:hypothetical protein
MGLISNVVFYKVGKRRGKRIAERQGSPVVMDSRDPECLNYESYCKNFGSCNGMACEYEEE